MGYRLEGSGAPPFSGYPAKKAKFNVGMNWCGPQALHAVCALKGQLKMSCHLQKDKPGCVQVLRAEVPWLGDWSQSRHEPGVHRSLCTGAHKKSGWV